MNKAKAFCRHGHDQKIWRIVYPCGKSRCKRCEQIRGAAVSRRRYEKSQSDRASETPAEPDLTKTPSIAMKNEMREILGLEPLKPETSVSHAPTCPVSRPGFVLIEGLQQCNCDFGKRLAETLGIPFTSDRASKP